MLKGAKTLVDVCTKTKPGENVLIVSDMANTSIAKTIATVAMDRGAETMMMVMEPRQRAGQEPPKPVAEAMKSADVVFVPVSYSITHTHAVKEAAEAGSRKRADHHFQTKGAAKIELGRITEIDLEGAVGVNIQVDYRQRQGGGTGLKTTQFIG